MAAAASILRNSRASKRDVRSWLHEETDEVTSSKCSLLSDSYTSIIFEVCFQLVAEAIYIVKGRLFTFTVKRSHFPFIFNLNVSSYVSFWIIFALVRKPIWPTTKKMTCGGNQLSLNSQGTQDENFRTKSNSRSTLEKLISQAQASDTPKTITREKIIKRNATSVLANAIVNA